MQRTCCLTVRRRNGQRASLLCWLFVVGLAGLLLVGCKKKAAEPQGAAANPGSAEQPGGMASEQQGEAGGGKGEMPAWMQEGTPGEPGMAQGGMPGEPGMAPRGMPGEPGMMPGEPGMAPGGMPGEPGMMQGEGMTNDIAGVYVGHGPWGYLLLNFRQDGVVDAGMMKGQYRYENGVLGLRLEAGMQGNLEKTEDGFRVTAMAQGNPLVLEFTRVAPFRTLQQLDGNWVLDTTVQFGPNIPTAVKKGQQQPGTIKDGLVYWGVTPSAASGKPFAAEPEGDTGRFAMPGQEGATEQRFTIYVGGKVMVVRRPKTEQGVVSYFVFLRNQT